MSSNLATLFVGQNLIIRDIIDSTNSLASALLIESRLPEGTAILAKEQSAGRGQQGTTWESEYGKNLLATFIFYPAFLSPKNIFFLNMTFSLALYDLASSMLGEGVSVKWPNDLYYKNKKLAGLLIENSIRNNEFNYSIVGIGMNINQGTFSTNAANPTSLKIELKEEQKLEHVFNLLCECIEARYLQLKSSKHEILKREYLQVLYQFNSEAKYKVDGRTISGKIVDVQDDGKLVVENVDGKITSYGFKEISFVI
jgi:BirA family transcriptional regulator, biotin operon repressor / biotin---[acetyl-CoA-carboxylase] ligase